MCRGQDGPEPRGVIFVRHSDRVGVIFEEVQPLENGTGGDGAGRVFGCVSSCGRRLTGARGGLGGCERGRGVGEGPSGGGGKGSAGEAKKAAGADHVVVEEGERRKQWRAIADTFACR